jgi:hypothetical protein
MKRYPLLFIYILLCLVFVSCVSAASPPQTEPLTIQYTFSAQPWLAIVYKCAGEIVINADLRPIDYLDITSVDMVMRIGGGNPDSLAYQIGTDELLVVVNPMNPVLSLTPGEVIGLFTGSIQDWKSISGKDAPVEVWVFDAGEDIQRVFEQTALGGAPITSLAHLAPGPDQMSQAIANDINAVGILTRSLTTENIDGIYTIAPVPVLVLVLDGPSAQAIEITNCLQK